MIQQQNVKLRCQKDDHKDEIDMICYNQFCTEFRLNCFKCIKKGIHHDHLGDVEKINNLEEFIENKNKECDNLIDDLNQLVESVNQSFSQFKTGIRNKYSLLKERLLHLNQQQINDFLNSIIKLTEYKQSITTIISEQSKKLTHSFNNLYEQLQLSSINYYQNSDNNIKLSKELYEIGYKLYMDDKYNQAIEMFDKSIQQDSNNHLSLCRKGECLKLLVQYENAITWFDKALAIEPQHVNSLSNKGDCLRLLKKYNETLKCLDQALSIDQHHTNSLRCKGACLQDQQKYKEALIYYQKSLKLESNHQWTKNQISILDFKNQIFATIN